MLYFVMVMSCSSSSSRSGSGDLPELPVESHLLSSNFIFSKQKFGKKKLSNNCVNIPGSRSGISLTIVRMKI